MSDWDWELTDTARRDFDSLDEYARDRIASKLDEIATDHPSISNRLKDNHMRSSVSVRFASAVGPTVPTTFSTFSGFASAAATHTAVTTMTENFARLFP